MLFRFFCVRNYHYKTPINDLRYSIFQLNNCLELPLTKYMIMDMKLPPLSLKQAAIFQLGKHLYISKNIHAQAETPLFKQSWLELNYEIIKNDVETLGLPINVKQCLLAILRPLGWEMINLMFAFQTLKIKVNQPFEICLSGVSGAVDHKTTAEGFVRDERNNVIATMPEKPLKLALHPPSLTNTCYANIALLLWSAKNFQKVLNAMKSNEKYHETTSGLESIILALPLPHNCKTFLKDFLYIIWGSINTWTTVHKKYWDSNEGPFLQKIYQSLVWTPRGRVDYEKTADNFVKDDTFGIAFRYRLSCLYCLEDVIHKIWSLLTPEDFHSFCPCKIKEVENKLVTYWSFTILGLNEELNRLFVGNEDNLSVDCSLLKFIIMYQGKSRNTAQFVHDRCTQEEKRIIFNHFKVNLPPLPEEMVLFLSLINPDDQIEIFRGEGVVNFFGCLLSWPWLDIYLRSFVILKNYIDDDRFVKLMIDIIRPITFAFEFQETTRIFEMLWEEASESRRRYVLEKSDDLLLDIVRFRRKATEQLILESLMNPDELKLVTDKLDEFKKMWASYLE